MSILSLDVSAASTGWVFTEDGIDFIYGTIKTKPKFERAERLFMFYIELAQIIKDKGPKYIVIEDTFAGKNIKTLKILNEFAGVAKFACKQVGDIEPYVISNHTVKSYFKAKKKEDMFEFICILFGKKDLTFKKDNDIIDSLAQLMCYSDEVLGLYSFRLEKDYGFMYFKQNILTES